MTATEAPGPRTEGALHLDGPPQGPIRLAVRSCMPESRCAKGPPTECRRVAPGPLLVGVARKHVKILGFWAADNFLFAPIRMQIGADLRHRVFEGVAKMRRRGL